MTRAERREDHREEWNCGWCGDTLRPYDGTWVGDVAGDYCPEGKAVGSTGTSPHLPVPDGLSISTEALDMQRLGGVIERAIRESRRKNGLLPDGWTLLEMALAYPPSEKKVRVVK
jgi:hypothetical protein